MVFIYLLYLYIRIYAIHENEICAKNKTITGLQRFKVSNFRGIGDVACAVTDMSGNMKQSKVVANENAQIAQQLDGEVHKFKF